MAKAILHSVLQMLHDSLPCVELHQYVDDLTTRAFGTTSEVVIELSESATRLISGLHALRH
eukprot:6522372-Alexandrium_andersonii.AAC.1